VDNTGDVTSSAATMYFKQNGSTIHTFSIPALTSSASPVTTTYGWTAVCDAVILIEINYPDALASDNSWTKTMSCGILAIDPDILKRFKLYEWRPIPFPPDPWWHDYFKNDDPKDVLQQIAKTLGGKAQPNYSEIKVLWMKFLKRSNGLNPNFALKFIGEQASKMGSAKFKSKAQLRGFALNLKNTLNTMAETATGFLKNKTVPELQQMMR
jgi:hypothetical protein